MAELIADTKRRELAEARHALALIKKIEGKG
jgi:hypothetical protein